MTDWPELFSNPELNPAALLPLLGIDRLDALSAQVYASHLPILWENPSFHLASLELPALAALVPIVERAFLDQQRSRLKEEIYVLVGPMVRERSIPLIVETMRMAYFRMNPLVSSLWVGSQGIPILKAGSEEGWPQAAWLRIIQHMRNSEITTLEISAYRVVCALQYDVVAPWVYLAAVRARYLVECAPQIWWDRQEEDSLETLRLWCTARKHLLAHIKDNIPLDWEVLRAPEYGYPSSPA
jgi:hypothetical protein